MVSRIRSYLTPPVFADGEKNRLVQMLYPILVAAGPLVGLALLVLLLLGNERALPPIVWLGITTASIPVYLALLRQGHVRIVGYGLALMIWAMCTVAVLRVGGTRSPGLGFLIFTIIYAFLVLGHHIGMFFYVLTMITLGLTLVAEHLDLLPEPAPLPTGVIVLVYMVIFTVSSWVVDVVTRKLRQAMEATLVRERTEIVSNFVAHSSHDLRTPLTVINTNAYLLRKSTDPLKQARYLATIEQQTARLAGMIDQLHELVKLSRIPQLETKIITLGDLPQSMSPQLIALADKKNISLTWQLPPAPPAIRGDRALIDTALGHVLHNALVYTPEGQQVVIRHYMNDAKAVIEVEDNGIGIAPEYHSAIFEQFYKVNEARTGNESGSGLGLTIVKLIMDMHHGKITFASIPGQGSTFRLIFPAA